MPILKKFGKFVLRSSTGTQTVSGVGFEPKLVLFFSAKENGKGTGEAHYMVGAYDGRSNISISGMCDNGITVSSVVPHRSVAFGGFSSPSDDSALPNANCIAFMMMFSPGLYITGTTANCTGFSNDGFTLSVSTMETGKYITVHYLALGGDILCRIRSRAAFSSENEEITYSNVPFQPKALLCFATETSNKSIEYLLSVGCAASPTKQWVACTSWSDISPSTYNRSAFSSTELCLCVQTDGSTITRRTRLTGFTSDGFSELCTTFSGSGYAPGFFIIFGGAIEVDAGTFTQPTTTGTQDIAADIVPELILFGSRGLDSADNDFSSHTTKCKHFIGLSIPEIADRALCSSSMPNVTVSVASNRTSETNALLIVGGNHANAHCSGFVQQPLETGGFRIRWDAVDNMERQFGWLAIRSTDQVEKKARYGRPALNVRSQWRPGTSGDNAAQLADEDANTDVRTRPIPLAKKIGFSAVEFAHTHPLSRCEDIYRCDWMDLSSVSQPKITAQIPSNIDGQIRFEVLQGHPKFQGSSVLGQSTLINPAAGDHEIALSGDPLYGDSLYFRIIGRKFMAITSYDAALAGAQPPLEFIKAATPTLVVGRPHSLFYLAGIPGAATAPTPGMSGEALTAYGGQIPFDNPQTGQNTHLMRFVAQATVAGTLLLCDRLWHNSGITITSTAAQTIDSVAFPERDINGTSEGTGVYVGVEVSTATGSGTPTLTINYTNSTGTSGRTATNTVATAASSAIGAFYPIGLQAGDVGVRSIQTFTLSATWTSGTIHLVAYRVLARLDLTANNVPAAIDALSSGFPRLFNNSVPFLLFIPSATTASSISGHVIWTQG